MTPENAPDRTLLHAASALGSSRALAARLGITHELLRSYMRAEQPPPEELVRRALAVLAAHPYQDS